MKIAKISLIFVLIIISFLGHSYAEETKDFLTSDHFANNSITNNGNMWSQDIAYVNGYIYAYLNDMSIVKCDINGNMELLCKLPTPPENLYLQYMNLSKGEYEQLCNTITYIVSDEIRLYGFNVYSGKWGYIDENGIHWQNIYLDTSIIKDQHSFFPKRIVRSSIIDNYLYTLIADSEDLLDYSIVSFNMLTGASTRIDIPHIINFCKADSNIIVLVYQNNQYTISKYDLKDNSISQLYSVKASEGFEVVGGLAYCEKKKKIAFVYNGLIHQCDLTGKITVGNSIPSDFLIGETRAWLDEDDNYFLWTNGVHIRHFNCKTDNNRLTIRAGTISLELMKVFESNYGIDLNIQNQIISIDKLLEMLRNKDGSVDIFEIKLDDTFDIIKKQYDFPLLSKSDYMVQESKNVDPRILGCICYSNGQIFAWPSKLFINIWQINEDFWTLAFGNSPLPQTIDEVLDYWIEWEIVGDNSYPELEFVQNFNYENWVTIFNRLFCEEPTPNNGELKNILDKLNTIAEIRKKLGKSITGRTMNDGQNYAHIFEYTLRQAMQEQKEIYYEDPLNDFVYGIYRYGFKETQIFLNSSLDDFQEGQMYVWIINPYSTHINDARNFIELASECVYNPYLWYAIHPNIRDPYPNTSFTDIVNLYQNRLSILSKEISSISIQDESHKILIAEYTYISRWLEHKNQFRWEITTQFIDKERKRLTMLNIR